MSGELSPALWGIPVVSGTSERAVLFPTPPTDQRVFNKATGNLERYSGTAWLTDFYGAASPVVQVNVKAFPFNAAGDGVADDTTAINNAIAAAGIAGGVVYFPPGIYKTTSAIVVPRWVRLVGANATGVAGGTTYDAVSTILGVHTGVAVLDFRGVQAASVKDLQVYGDQTTTPKTGILLGRTSASSAGFHLFDNVSVEGYFSVAAVYSIASEENTWYRPHFSLLGGGAKYVFYTSQGDDLAVGGLTGSSNIQGTMYSPWMSSQVNDATSAIIFINAGASTFAWTFVGGYLLPKSGAYVVIKTGAVDGSNTPGPFTFLGVSGEKIAGGLNPISGFDFQTAGAFTIRGVQILGCKFELDAAGFFIRQAAALTIRDFLVKTMNGMGVGSSLIPAQIFNSQIDSGSGTANQFYGDIDTADNSVIASGDNTKGYFFGAGGVRLRWQNAVSQIQAVIASGASFVDFAVKVLFVGGATPISTGSGSPETVVTAPVGALYLRTNGGAGTTLYVKESGAGNTGWIAK